MNLLKKVHIMPNHYQDNHLMNKDLRIVFIGTPEFAVASLDALIKNKNNIVGVITSPDKPVGRGRKIKYSAIKEYSLKYNLTLLQPTNLKDNNFIKELRSLRADLQIIVAFRMLPDIVWDMPRLGTFSIHPSLLPQYRGAAPINRAIINGETQTGITSFFLKHNIDTGNIIFNKKITIGPEETAGELHDKLMKSGAELTVKTVKAIQSGNYLTTNQHDFYNKNNKLKYAPKILKKDCRINWNDSVDNIYNFIRGLSPHPAAYTEFISPDNKRYYIKIFKTLKEKMSVSYKTGEIVTDGKNNISITAIDGLIHLQELQLSGKGKMNTKEFLRGFRINNNWKV